ncbi:hypothetical protein [Novosphingobium sp. KACC 22771]|uniref:hypothetical protein n=1 Tax=Novosphingobium sp. KACC 22771 TaxID=3025670 RepID=UPI0023662873|nr:hypothetical protein [Novosphingobium sp. KACC 22771]WDF73045.1 hypothetical protein PQ467_03110 [Novosphingobium sp. KACC 22771]
MTGSKRKLTPRFALNRLRRAFQRELGLGATSARALLSSATLYDKAYELSCLTETMKELRHHLAGATFTLKGGGGAHLSHQGWSDSTRGLGLYRACHSGRRPS